MNKKAQTKNVAKSPKPVRIVRVSIHPLLLLLSVFLLLFLVGGMLNRQSDVVRLPVGELIAGIKDGRFSRVTLQDSGEVLAQEKYVFVAKLGEVEKGESNLVKEGVHELVLDEVDMAKLVEEVSPADPLAYLRGLLTGQTDSPIVELIIAENFIIARKQAPGAPDLIVRDVTEDDLLEALRDRNVRLSDLQITFTRLTSASKNISVNAFGVRAKSNNEFLAIYIVDGLGYGRVRNEKITTFATQWDGGFGSFADTLQREGISLSSPDVQFGSLVVATVPWGDLISLITLVGLIVLGFLLFRGIQSSGSGLMRFGQSRARMFWGVKPDISFKDVAGVDEAKEELNEIVQFLKSPDKFRKLGARIPKGVLMVGAPGTGKTLLARAIAGEAGVPFFHTSGSEFEEMLVGAGASRVRDLFDKAKKSAPALIFIDEIDAVARKRGTTIQSSTTEQTLNQILVEMDGFEQGTNVIVIAATNRPDVLDPAILRPGRFDRRVVLDLPDIEGRKQILAVHAKNKPLAAEVDLERVAKRTIGFSGAELENTLNEAAIIAAKNDRKEIIFSDIEEAATKVTMGPVRRSIKRTDEEIKLVAVHEAGHAMVSKFVPQADPVHRVSILSRGMSGGATHFLPQDDNRMMSKTRLLSRIVVALGGRAAEEVILGDVSTGAAADIDSVTSIVRNMVQKYGMSEKLGLIKYGESNELQYLGYGYGEQRDYSDDTAKMIDEEVRHIVEDSYAQARDIVKKHRKEFDKLVDLLLEKEVLEAEEFEALFT